jgi:hypothetical protein
MSQTWSPPTGTTILSQAVKTDLPNMAESLRTRFSGSSAPSSPVAYMRYVDTTLNKERERNAANSAWIDVGPVGVDLGQRQNLTSWGTLSATTTRRAIIMPVAGRVIRVALWSDTTSASSSGNEWQFTLFNQTASLNLFSGTVGTFTALGGVGGGAEITANVAYLLTPNQNQSPAANALLYFTMTKVGTATSLTTLDAQFEFTITG